MSSTLTRWYSAIEGRLGFTKEALMALKTMKDAEPFIMDEMKIKASSEQNPATKRNYGNVNYDLDF